MITTMQGDCRAVLPTLPEKSVQMCVTSPPFYGLRAYLPAGHPDKAREIGQEPIPDCMAWARRRIIGAEPAIDEDGETYYIPTYGKPEPPCGRCYVCALRAVFAGVWRVLRDDGLLFLNLGDSYNSASNFNHDRSGLGAANRYAEPGEHSRNVLPSLPEKSLLGIPWRTALALQADGWVLRNDNIWAKANPMPESVQDRCTRSHEYVFMLAKSARYFYDSAAVAEPAQLWGTRERTGGKYHKEGTGLNPHTGLNKEYTTRNRRTVWTINTQPYTGTEREICDDCQGTGKRGELAELLTYSIAKQRRRNAITPADVPSISELFDLDELSAVGAELDLPDCPTCEGTGYIADDSDHYAVFPEALVEIPIRAGSSAQACEHCGAAWRRVVERTGATNVDNEVIADYDVPGLAKKSSADRVRRLDGKNYQHVTRGTDSFTPGCTCENNTGSAASVVLDPFAGSGTTLRVAERLGRNAIGIELSESYITDHIEKRTNGVQKEMFV